MAETAVYDASLYLERNLEARGVSGWRSLYLSFIEDLAPFAVIELGADAPEFLDRIEAKRRVAVDTGHRFAEAFRSRNIEFFCRNLEQDSLDDLGPVDVAICSDVFEHLTNPAAALDRIAELIGFHGVLFSNVPNEYHLSQILKVMLDRGGPAAQQAGRGMGRSACSPLQRPGISAVSQPPFCAQSETVGSALWPLGAAGQGAGVGCALLPAGRSHLCQHQ